MNITVFDRFKDLSKLSRKISSFPESELLTKLASLLKKQDEANTVESENMSNEKGKKIVAGLVKKSNRILATISTHRFPFDFFPDTLNIEESRITIIKRTFFLTSEIHSVDIADISNIFINVAPFFAQLIILSSTYKENEIKIGFLNKNEAIKARRIIEGLRTFSEKEIETSQYSKDELISKLEELSTTKIVI